MNSCFYSVFKPCGCSSGYIVSSLKRILHRKDIGHLGTLDPMACGVLPIAVGKATRLFDMMLQKTKVYRAFFEFGVTSDTLDGDTLNFEFNNQIPTVEQVLKVLPKLEGNIAQIPPAFSAKKINGAKAYDLARSGQDIQLKSKNITIDQIKFLRKMGNTYVFDITCSSGTYIRSIARDMASELNTIGLMSGLIRLKSGFFNITRSFTLDEIQKDNLGTRIEVEEVIQNLPRLDLYGNIAKQVLNGIKMDFDELKDGLTRIYCDDKLIGLGKRQNGCLKIPVYLKD